MININTISDVNTLENEKIKIRKEHSAKSVICVMSYNVGHWYNGTSSNVPIEEYERYYDVHKSIIERYCPDILMTQEYWDTISTGHNADTELFDKYFYYSNSSNGDKYTRGKSISSIFPITDYTTINYQAQDEYNTRDYAKAYTYINGRKVCLITTHFSINTANKTSQSAELLRAIEDEGIELQRYNAIAKAQQSGDKDLEVSDDEIKKLRAINSQLVKINSETDELIEKKLSPNNLTFERYQEILQLVQKDEQLKMKLREKLKEKLQKESQE